jgi:hypothetical protein
MANTKSLDLELSSSQYASIADAGQTGLDLSEDITLEAWIKLEQKASTAGTVFTIISKADGALNKRLYGFNIASGDDKLSFYVSDNGTADSGHFLSWVSTTAMTTIATWFHVAVSLDLSTETCHFYVNGVEEDGTISYGDSVGASLAGNDVSFKVGAYADDGSADKFFDGLIDEVRVWNDIRSQAEISANYETELIGNEANLIGYWKFNDSALDETSNNNDLTLNGSPSYSADIPTWTIDYTIGVIVGSFTLTGITVGLLRPIINMVVSAGSFVLTGITTIFTKVLNIVLEVGNFTLTGIDTILTKALIIVANTGTFVLTGVANIFTKALNIICSVATFTLTGITAALKRGYTIVCVVSSFILTGVTIGLLRPIINMAVSVGSFILTGIEAVINKFQFQIFIKRPNVVISESKVKVGIEKSNINAKINGSMPITKI